MYVRCSSTCPFGFCPSFRKLLHQACIGCKYSCILSDFDASEVLKYLREKYGSSYADFCMSHFVSIEDFGVSSYAM